MTDKETWLLWQDCSHSPYENMAIDELLLLEASTLGAPLIRIYDWDRPSVSIGYVQKYEAAPQQGYVIVRRPTGGGIVFHDSDLTYTAVIPIDHSICALDRMESYHVFHRAVLRTLVIFGRRGQLSPDECGPVDRATMQCFTTPTRYDVVCDNAKYAGAAQRRSREGILHQGSIALKAADGDKSALVEQLVKSLREEFKIDFTSYFPTAELLAGARTLAEEKYSRPEWNVTRTWKQT